MSNQEAERWISVEDRLPPLEESVLIFSLRHDPITAVLCKEKNHGSNQVIWQNSAGGSDLVVEGNVTHWMPLPASPKADAGGEKV